MGRFFKTAEEHREEEEKIHSEYIRALDAFNAFLDRLRSQSTPQVETVSESTGEGAHESLLPVQASQMLQALSCEHLEQMKDRAIKLISGWGVEKPHPELKPLMTRALNATREAVQASKNPENLGERSVKLKEFFWAQLAVSRAGDAAKGVFGSMTGISLAMLVVGSVFLVTGFGAGVGFILFTVGLCAGGLSSVGFAAAHTRAVDQKSDIANDMSQTRKALSPRAAAA